MVLSTAGYNEDAFNLLVFTNPPGLINVTAERAVQADNTTISFAVRPVHRHASFSLYDLLGCCPSQHKQLALSNATLMIRHLLTNQSTMNHLVFYLNRHMWLVLLVCTSSNNLCVSSSTTLVSPVQQPWCLQLNNLGVSS